jgi:hypothetical protein
MTVSRAQAVNPVSWVFGNALQAEAASTGGQRDLLVRNPPSENSSGQDVYHHDDDHH